MWGVVATFRETNKKHNHLVKNNTKISVFFNVFVLKLLACVCQYNNLVTFLKVGDGFVLLFSRFLGNFIFIEIFVCVFFKKRKAQLTGLSYITLVFFCVCMSARNDRIHVFLSL